MAKLINKFRWKAMLMTDSRVRTMNEILSSIKLIKMYAWEDSFEKKIAGMRLTSCKLVLFQGCINFALIVYVRYWSKAYTNTKYVNTKPQIM